MGSHFFRFLGLGLLQPGLICSKVRRQRESFSVMDSTVAVQTKGFGAWFQAARNSSMQAFNFSTLPNDPQLVQLFIGHYTSVFDRYNIVSERDLHDAARKIESHLAEVEKKSDRATSKQLLESRGVQPW